MPGEMSFQPTGQVGHAVSAIMAETGAAGQASVAAIAESSRSSAALFLAARQAQLAAAAADVIAAAEDGSAAALSRPLRRFETLTTALWTVQFEVCAPGASPPRPALAAGASARAAVTASAGLPGYQFGPLFGPAPGLDGLGDGGVSPGFCPLDAFGRLGSDALGLGSVSGGGFGQVLVSFPGSGRLGGQAGGHVPGRSIGGLAHRHHAHGRPRPAGPDHPDPWP